MRQNPTNIRPRSQPDPARGASDASTGEELPDGVTVTRRFVAEGPLGRVLLVDSITQLEPGDAGVIAVSGSHGGRSSGAFALEVPLAAAVFNDAGIGKDEAGIAALAMLQARGVPALTVAHTSARIGDAADAWACGVISRVNAAAAALGWCPGQPLRSSLLGAPQRAG